jgi:hypothetical protein
MKLWENNAGGNLTKLCCKQLCKYHNVPPVQLLHTNKNLNKISNEVLNDLSQNTNKKDTTKTKIGRL